MCLRSGFSVALIALFCLQAFADFSGKVTSVTDGDTIQVLNGTEPVKVRLDGVDAPERRQPFGTAARHFVAEACFGKAVTVQETDTDRYGRTVAVIVLEDGKTLNHEIVEQGFAWWRFSRHAKWPWKNT